MVMITIFVFVMMLIVDYINVLTKGDMEKALKGGRRRQYAIASFLGATPGCLGAFMNVSFSFHHLWTRILGFRRFCQGKYDIDIWVTPIPFRPLKMPLKVRETLQEARNMQANTIIKASAISLPSTKGCARILFVTQRGKLNHSAWVSHSMGSNSTSPQVVCRRKGNQRTTLPRSMGNNPILLHIPLFPYHILDT